jgi:hypothetical protein
VVGRCFLEGHNAAKNQSARKSSFGVRIFWVEISEPRVKLEIREMQELGRIGRERTYQKSALWAEEIAEERDLAAAVPNGNGRVTLVIPLLQSVTGDWESLWGKS